MRRTMLALAATLAVLLPGAPAWAHNQLVASDPAEDATVTKAPTTVTLTFLERLNPQFTTIVVSDAARQPVTAGAPTVDGARGTVTLNAALANGAYTVAYRIVSIDGHTVQGDYTFTVADPALPTAATPSAATASAASTGSGGGIPGGVLIGIGALGIVLALAAAYLYLTGRRRTRTTAGTFPPS